MFKVTLRGFAFCIVTDWSDFLNSIFVSKEVLLSGNNPINRYFLSDLGKINCMDVFNTAKHNFVNKAHAELTFHYFYFTEKNDLSAEDPLELDKEVRLRTREQLEKSFMSYEMGNTKKELSSSAAFSRTQARFQTTKTEMKKFEIPLDTKRITVFCWPEENLISKWVYLLNYAQHKGNL